MLELTVLVENKSGRDDLFPANGLSFLFEDGDERILFDTGPDETFLTNAKILGVSLEDITNVVLSHGHYDHAGGIPALASFLEKAEVRPNLICHPDWMVERYVGTSVVGKQMNFKKLDAGLDMASVSSCFNLIESREPYKIGSRFTFLGEIPRSKKFKGGGPFGVVKDGDTYKDDYLYDDTGIVWEGEEGLVIITGCSHSGICNVIEKAQAVTGVKNIAAIVGGLHLRTASVAHLYEVRSFLKKMNVKRSFACHCTGKWGIAWLPDNQTICTGSKITFV